MNKELRQNIVISYFKQESMKLEANWTNHLLPLIPLHTIYLKRPTIVGAIKWILKVH